VQHVAFDRAVRAPGETAFAAPMQAAAGAVPGGKLSNIVQLSETRAILSALDSCGGSRVAAARKLGISERTLRYRLAEFRESGIAVAGSRR